MKLDTGGKMNVFKTWLIVMIAWMGGGIALTVMQEMEKSLFRYLIEVLLFLLVWITVHGIIKEIKNKVCYNCYYYLRMEGDCDNISISENPMHICKLWRKR